MDKALRDRKYCDVVIVYNHNINIDTGDKGILHIGNDHKYFAHRIILSTSKLFMNLLETSKQMQIDGVYYYICVVNLPSDINIEIFTKLLNIMYNYNIHNDNINILDNVNTNELIDILKTADYLELDELCTTKIFKDIFKLCDTIDDINYCVELGKVIQKYNISDYDKNFYTRYLSQKYIKGFHYNEDNKTLTFVPDKKGIDGTYEYDGYNYIIYTTYDYTNEEHGYWLVIKPKDETTITQEQYMNQDKTLLKNCTIRITLFDKKKCNIVKSILSFDDKVFFVDYVRPDMNNTNKHYIPSPICVGSWGKGYDRQRYGIITNCGAQNCELKYEIIFN